MNALPKIILVLSLPGLFACQTAEQSDRLPSPERSTQPIRIEGLRADCFYTRQVTNWESLNKVNLLVYESGNRIYLVEIATPSTALRSSTNIAFRGSGGRVCGRAGDRLIVGLDRGRDFAVVGVRRLPRETADLLIENKRQRDNPEPVMPQESPGAEVVRDVTPDTE